MRPIERDFIKGMMAVAFEENKTRDETNAAAPQPRPGEAGMYWRDGKWWILPVGSEGLIWAIGETCGVPYLYDHDNVEHLPEGGWLKATIGPLTSNAELLERAERAERERDRLENENNEYRLGAIATANRLTEVGNALGLEGKAFALWGWGSVNAALTDALAAKESAERERDRLQAVCAAKDSAIAEAENILVGEDADFKNRMNRIQAAREKLREAIADAAGQAYLDQLQAAETRLAEVERGRDEWRQKFLDAKAPAVAEVCLKPSRAELQAQIATLTRELAALQERLAEVERRNAILENGDKKQSELIIEQRDQSDQLTRERDEAMGRVERIIGILSQYIYSREKHPQAAGVCWQELLDYTGINKRDRLPKDGT